PARLERGIEIAERSAGLRAEVFGREAQPQLDALAGADGEAVVRRGLGAGAVRVDRIAAAVDQIVVDPVLDPGSAVRRTEQPLVVGLVLREEQRRVVVAEEVALAELGVRGR